MVSLLSERPSISPNTPGERVQISTQIFVVDVVLAERRGPVCKTSVTQIFVGSSQKVEPGEDFVLGLVPV